MKITTRKEKKFFSEETYEKLLIKEVSDEEWAFLQECRRSAGDYDEWIISRERFDGVVYVHVRAEVDFLNLLDKVKERFPVEMTDSARALLSGYEVIRKEYEENARRNKLERERKEAQENLNARGCESCPYFEKEYMGIGNFNPLVYDYSALCTVHKTALKETIDRSQPFYSQERKYRPLHNCQRQIEQGIFFGGNV